jgi:hypothetical protein
MNLPVVTVNRWRIGVALYAGIFVLVNALVWFASYPKWNDLRRLTFNGVLTEGRVTGKEPANHLQIRYEFAVGDLRITGSGGAGRGGVRSFSEVELGMAIPVTYLPDEPTLSVPGNPGDLYDSWSTLLFLVAPLGGLVAASAALFRIGTLGKGNNGVR